MSEQLENPASGGAIGNALHPLHVAVIMDGNGRWAVERGLPRRAGYRAGARAVRRVVSAARSLSIGTLTLYAHSSANWARPGVEVAAMLSAIEEYLRELVSGCGHGVQVIGRRDRLPVGLLDAIERVESATRDVAHSFLLRLAIDYSSRHAIVAAARAAAGVAGGPADLTVEAFARLLDPGSAGAAPDVDLLIRAGGEQRLSDFLLWECAYAELVFTSRLWPDFGAAELADALAEYRRRDRRFGRVARAAGAAT